MAKQNNFQTISQGDDNNLSLQISAELTINLLASTLPDALTFFYFISLLPGGVSPDELLVMWGTTHEECTRNLQ
jgi:hypothetical protein